MDQLSKILVRAYVDLNEAFSVWGISMTHIENSGMAGGRFEGYARLFGIASVVFVIAVLYYRRTGERRGLLFEYSMGFLVGGAIGNGMDRLLFGQVTDFIIRSGGVLNIADHAIEAGVALLVIHVLVKWIRQWK